MLLTVTSLCIRCWWLKGLLDQPLFSCFDEFVQIMSSFNCLQFERIDSVNVEKAKSLTAAYFFLTYMCKIFSFYDAFYKVLWHWWLNYNFLSIHVLSEYYAKYIQTELAEVSDSYLFITWVFTEQRRYCSKFLRKKKKIFCGVVALILFL